MAQIFFYRTVFAKSFCLADQIMNGVISRGSDSIISLEMVPFGNANYTVINRTKEQFDIEFKCEYRPQECRNG
jgi:hypothetical protein